MTTETYILLGVIAGGVAGCLATSLIANLVGGVPYSAVAGSWKKHLFSILFMVPVPFLAGISTLTVGSILALLWLWLAPTIASKAHFGPKEAPWSKLLTFHAAFAIVGFGVWLVVSHLPLMMGSA